MLIYNLAMVDDRGSYWNINGVTKNSFESIDQEAKYLKLSHVAYKMIDEALLKGDIVRVTKPLQVDEVLPGEVQVLKVDPSDINSVRDSEIKRVRMLITPELASVAGLTFYRFTCLNNELSDKGFFITDDNREEKYLAMLETGDQKLIDKLEEYLNYKDEIHRVANLHEKFTIFFKDIKGLAEKEKIIELSNNFMEDYYSRF